MRIRRFHPGDLNKIITLFRGAVRSVNLGDYDEFQVEAWAPDDIDPGPWLKRMTRNTTFVAVDDGDGDDDVPIGFTELKEDGTLLMMFVHKDHQRQGIATALLNTLEHEARGKGMTQLKTEASITAVPFFTASGFEVMNEQNLHLKGQAFKNFAMRKFL